MVERMHWFWNSPWGMDVLYADWLDYKAVHFPDVPTPKNSEFMIARRKLNELRKWLSKNY